MTLSGKPANRLVGKRKADQLNAIAHMRYHVPHCSQQALLQIIQYCRAHGLPDIHGTRDVRAARDVASCKIETPYGFLTKELSFSSLDGGSDIPIEITDPWALFTHVCKNSCFFSSVLEHVLEHHGQCTAENPLHLLLYSDEVTPGNQLAHKNARKSQTMYWSLFEFLSLLSHEELWQTQTVVAVDTVAQIQGGWSKVVSECVKSFFHETEPSKDMSIAGISVVLYSGRRVLLFIAFGLRVWVCLPQETASAAPCEAATSALCEAATAPPHAAASAALVHRISPPTAPPPAPLGLKLNFP